MSTGLATTGVDGLAVIIAEAAISSWYDYYRENGLVCSPGGYPGEDLDVLTELTYSRNLLAGDYLNHNSYYEILLRNQTRASSVSLETTINSGTIAITFKKQNILTVKWFIPMVFKTGMSNQGKSITFSTSFLKLLANTYSCTMDSTSICTIGNLLISAKA